jgi:endonuclease/exonuclease/phosphatase family metal-dependent hydrolase
MIEQVGYLGHTASAVLSDHLPRGSVDSRLRQLRLPRAYPGEEQQLDIPPSAARDAALYWASWNGSTELRSIVDTAARAIVRGAVPVHGDRELPMSSVLTLMSLSSEGRDALESLLPLLATVPDVERRHVSIALDFTAKDCAAPVGVPTSVKSFVSRASELGRCGFLALMYASLPDREETSFRHVREQLQSEMDVEELRVATLNIGGLPWWLKGERLMRDPSQPAKKLDRYVQIGRSLRERSFDLVGVQEMFDSRTVSVAREAGLAYRAHGGSVHGTLGVLGGDGLMILSRYPIEWSEMRPFTSTTGVERWVRKGALFARIVLPGNRKLLVTNVHTISSTSYISSARAEGIRTAQMSELRGWQQELREPGIGELTLGDFNTNLDAAQPVETGMFDLYRLRYSRHNGTPHTAAGFTFDPVRNHRAACFAFSEKGAGSSRIDGLFASEDVHRSLTALETRLEFTEEGEQVSDHFGVSARLIRRR